MTTYPIPITEYGEHPIVAGLLRGAQVKPVGTMLQKVGPFLGVAKLLSSQVSSGDVLSAVDRSLGAKLLEPAYTLIFCPGGAFHSKDAYLQIREIYRPAFADLRLAIANDLAFTVVPLPDAPLGPVLFKSGKLLIKRRGSFVPFAYRPSLSSSSIAFEELAPCSSVEEVLERHHEPNLLESIVVARATAKLSLHGTILPFFAYGLLGWPEQNL